MRTLTLLVVKLPRRNFQYLQPFPGNKSSLSDGCQRDHIMEIQWVEGIWEQLTVLFQMDLSVVFGGKVLAQFIECKNVTSHTSVRGFSYILHTSFT
jgi:hypothetical protein